MSAVVPVFVGEDETRLHPAPPAGVFYLVIATVSPLAPPPLSNSDASGSFGPTIIHASVTVAASVSSKARPKGHLPLINLHLITFFPLLLATRPHGYSC